MLVTELLDAVQGPAVQLDKAALAKAWVALMGKDQTPLSTDELSQLLKLEEKKSNGGRGFYRYKVVTVLARYEIEQRTQPTR